MSPFTYAGIGARKTPPEMLETVKTVAAELAKHGATLRSGGAYGADEAFEDGHRIGMPNGPKEIFIPWNGFQSRSSKERGVMLPPEETYKAAQELAANHHPYWGKLSGAVKALMVRNSFQIFGPSMDDPVKFTLCYTEHGLGLGGTGQAIRICRAHGIPYFDLAVTELPVLAAKIEELLQ